MRRILSIWLPQWSIDRLRRAGCTASPDSSGRPGPKRAPGAKRPAQPLALTLSGQGGLRITATNKAAREHGLLPGMRLADARAILPSLAARPAEPEADAAALLRLAEWCGQFSPWTNCDPPDGLWLDSSGSSHLFGGEEALMARLHRRLADLGFEARLGLAETPGGAWALARYATEERAPCRLAEPGRLRDALAPLPVEALRLSEETARLLQRLGLRRVGQLYDLPRAALGRRFHAAGESAGEAALLQRLDETLGRLKASLSPLRPTPAYRARISLAEPLVTLEVLGRLLDDLLQELCAALEKDSQGARQMSLACYRVDGSLARQSIALARPSQEPAHCRRLFAERLEEIDAGFGIETLVLTADVVEPLAARQGSFDEAASPRPKGDVAQLVDRLSNRLGRAAVKQAELRQSHLPERAVRHLAAIMALENGKPAARKAEATCPEPPGDLAPRPFRLLPHPEPIAVTAEIPEGPPLSFTWRHQVHRVARAEGPERIAPEWWLDLTPQDSAAQHADDRTLLRDYYRVEDGEGRRYWLFRAGLYGDAQVPGAPNWYLHGFFA